MRKTFWLVMLAAFSFALVACGSDEETAESDGGAVGRAVSATIDAGTARNSFEIVLRLPGLDKPVTIEGGGTDDYENERGRIVVDGSSILEAVPDADLPSFVRLKAEIVYEERTVYVKLPFASLKTGKEWIRIRPDAFEGTQSQPRLDGLSQSTPANFMRVLRATSGSITTLGNEEVRGVATTHYRASIDLDNVVEQFAPEEDREELRTALAELKKAVGGTIPIDVWVDADDLVRRLKGDVDVSLEGERLGVGFDVEYYDFGTDVDVDIPDDADVVDIEELLNLGSAKRRTSGY
jgi:hypothetical protein